MITLSQGAERTFLAEYKAAEALVDPDNPLVDVLDPAGNVVVADGVPVRLDQGHYSYLVVLPMAAPLGQWEIRWTGVINGFLVSSSESFNVVEPGQVSAGSSAVQSVRELTHELEGGDYSTERIEDLLVSNGGSINRVVLHIWRSKAARYAKYIDINESGSNRSFSQLHKNAMAEVASYQKVVDGESTALMAAVGRAVGRSINILDTPPASAAGAVLYGPGTVRG